MQISANMGTTKCWEILELLSDWRLLKEGSGPQSQQKIYMYVIGKFQHIVQIK
jgi:hypothetical protein